MKTTWTPLAVAYLVLAIIGLVGTFVLNVWSVVEARNYLSDVFGSGPAVSSIGVDLLVVAVAGSVLIVVEARRLGMKRAWLYIVLSAVTAFAFTFPLFLAMRERALERRRRGVATVPTRDGA
ncbi:DUF2834 domain-containing protein [Microbacterium sp. P01]|uniref:DUF2834 domain-containing protein n=1 Tax=unclassified Microbacterium TaxID=2609290 RepID=UPI00366FD792